MLHASPFAAREETEGIEPFMQRIAERTIEIAVECEQSYAGHFNLRQYRDDSHRSAGASFDLDRQGYEDGAFRRQLLEIGDVFEAIKVRAVDDLMDDEILRRTIVDARRIDADAVHVTLLHKKFGGLS